MEEVLLAGYPDPRSNHNPSDTATLLEMLELKGRNFRDSLSRGLARLDKLVTSNVNNQTNVVRLSVDSHYPELAALVANRFVERLNEFNAQTRQSQARERRQFVEARVAEAERELRGAEDSVRNFYERNRSWEQSPLLVFEEARQRRQLEIRQELYLTLKREYETARIEEVNETPVITVVDLAVVPQSKSEPKRRLMVGLALLFGVIAAVCWAFITEHVQRLRQTKDSEYEELQRLIRRFRSTTTRART
jgi:uncharacterized protein involved in exopolysaccharide biosynthesis